MSRTSEALKWLLAAPGRTQRQAAEKFNINQPAVSVAYRAHIKRTVPAAYCQCCGQRLPASVPA